MASSVDVSVSVTAGSSISPRSKINSRDAEVNWVFALPGLRKHCWHKERFIAKRWEAVPSARAPSLYQTLIDLPRNSRTIFPFSPRGLVHFNDTGEGRVGRGVKSEN